MAKGSGDSVTIRDVAARAGVSKSTVSKYLTSTPYVSADARERIERAVTELGYRPNASARALVGGQSRFVGVLVPSIANPYQADLLAGIERAASPHQFGTLLAIADNDVPRERGLLQGLLKSGAYGVIVTSAHAEDAEVQALRRAGVPVVLAGRHIAAPEIDSVVIDNRQGARLAVDHLVELGHERIAHISGPLTVLDFAQRAEGYRDALLAHGLEPMPLLGGDRLPDPERGREAVRAIMDMPEDERPTAVFAAVDWIAVGVLAEASRRGIEVPNELSVIGFDNVSFCELTTPSLSTVDAHPERIGQRAVDRLVEQISSGSRDERGTNEVLAPTLVVRLSTGGPKS